MNKLITLLIFFLFISLTTIKTQAQNCFEINTILADACGNPEGENEMVFFTVGNTPLNTPTLTIAWPNGANAWLGLAQNAQTLAKTATLNASIQACGYLVEPTAGILPAFSKVLLVTSENMDPAFNSFAGLTDTVLIIYQAAGNTSGHFKNFGSNTPRILTMYFGACTDVVSYIPDSLIDQSGMHVPADGATIEFSAAGNPTYTNPGCQAPVTVLGATLSASDSTVCAGATVTISANNITGNFVNFFWINGNGVVANTSDTVTTYQTNGSFTGIDTIQFALIGTCFDTVYYFLPIQINSGGVASIVANGPTTFCTGDSVTLTASGGTSYLWSTGSTAASITVLQTGNYIVTVTNACGTSSASQSVTVSNNAVAVITPSGSTALCNGQSVILTATGGSSYLWSTTSTSNFITVTQTGTYIVTVTSSCGSDTASISVTAGTAPSVAISANGPTSFCQGDSVQLTATGTGNFLWSNGSSNATITVLQTGNYSVIASNACGADTAFQQITVTAGTSISITPSGATTFCQGGSVTLTASGGAPYLWSTGATTNTITVLTSATISVTGNSTCGSNVDSIVITVTLPPSASIVANGPVTFCAGGSVTLTANGNGTYIWSTGATTSSINVVSGTTYSVTVTNTCGSSSASQLVTVNPLPTASISASGLTTFCAGGSVTLTASGGTSYLWSTGVITSSIAATQSGNYIVTATNTCGNDTAAVLVTVNNPPVAQISSTSNPAVLCPGETLNLSSVTAPSYVYQWSTGDSTSQIVISTGGLYVVTVSNNCGVDTDSLNVIESVLAAAATATPDSGLAPLVVSFTNSSINAVTNYWNFGDGNTSNVASPQHTYTSYGNYNAELTVTDSLGCTLTLTFPVFVDEIVNFQLPNIFTPNGDSKNDNFEFINSSGVKEFNATIYNRWGNEVYTNSSNGIIIWNGNNKSNNECVAGTYFYAIDILTVKGEKIKRNGIVELIK